MSHFDACQEIIFCEEVGYEQYKKGQSGYTNDPKDKGGETRWGLSKRYNPELDIKNLSKQEAKEVYRKKYWNIFHGDQIEDYGLALLLFDSTVNPGPGRSLKWMQSAINYINIKGPKLEVDGKFGPKSVAALNKISKEGYGKALAVLFIAMKGTWHMEQVDRDPGDVRYFKGWIQRMSRIAKEVFK